MFESSASQKVKTWVEFEVLECVRLRQVRREKSRHLGQVEGSEGRVIVYSNLMLSGFLKLLRTESSRDS